MSSQQNWIEALGPLLGAGGVVAGISGFWAWLSSRPKGQADIQASTAAIQASQAAYSEALNAQGESFAAAMFKLVEQKDGVIAQLQADMTLVKQQNLDCQAESRQQKAVIRALRHELERAGVLDPQPIKQIGISPAGDPVWARLGQPVTPGAVEVPATSPAFKPDPDEGGSDV